MGQSVHYTQVKWGALMRLKNLLILITLCIAFSRLFAAIPSERDCLFRYSFTIKDIPSGTREIRIGIPYPAENFFQQVNDLSRENWPVHFASDKVYGNRILYYVISQPQGPTLSIERVYRIKRKEFVNKPLIAVKNITRSNGLPESKLRPYVAEDGFVLITDYVRRLASQITAGKTTDIEKARAIYDYLFKNLTYDKSIPGWGKGDIERICLLRSGNCTDFHSFFIALCRACGIPAKFVTGVLVSEKSKINQANYHCWAEFYTLTYGWVPVDISEAWKDKSKYEYFFGAVDANRVELSHGRGIKLEPFQKSGRLNYFVYPYVEIDGKAYENVETVFFYENISEGKRKEDKDEEEKTGNSGSSNFVFNCCAWLRS